MSPDRPLKKARRAKRADTPVPPEPTLDKGVAPRENPPLPRTRGAAIFAIVGRWLDAPAPVLRLELIRIVAPLATLGFMSSRLAHVEEWLTNVGYQPPELVNPSWRQPLYLSPLSPSMAWLLAAVMVLSGLAVAAGFRARAAAVVFALTLAYVALADRLAAFTVSKLSPAVMLALAASPCGARLGVDAWRRRRKLRVARDASLSDSDPSPSLGRGWGGGPAKLPASVAAGGARFFQLLLPVFYLGSGISKARGDWLHHPLVLWTHVHDSYQTGLSWALGNAMPRVGWTALQWITLIFELGAPIWLAVPKTRPYALGWAVAMHAMIGMMFWPVRWFSLLMIGMLLGAYLPEAWLTRAAARSTAA
jgi:uncharacterized membrane protein YphA (DoxX/SURF4 family)